MILEVIFVVLMIFWFVSALGGLPTENRTVLTIGGGLIPPVCVSILGWCIFNGIK